MFDEARNYATENGLETEDITLKEVEALVSQYRQSCLWDIEQERMVILSAFIEFESNFITELVE